MTPPSAATIHRWAKVIQPLPVSLVYQATAGRSVNQSRKISPVYQAAPKRPGKHVHSLFTFYTYDIHNCLVSLNHGEGLPWQPTHKYQNKENKNMAAVTMTEIMNETFSRMMRDYEHQKDEVKERLISLYHPEAWVKDTAAHYLKKWPDMYETGFAFFAGAYPDTRAAQAFDLVGIAVTEIIDEAIKADKERKENG